MDQFEIFLAALPGLEDLLAAEARETGFEPLTVMPGGVSFKGHWQDVWRANLCLRGASRVLARIGGFRAMHLAQLDKRARKFPWGDYLRPDTPIRVEVTCRKSKIYHAKAASQRIERAISEELGATISDEAELRLMARIEDDFCSFSIDTSGEPLHRRGHKIAVGKAPLRETMAALFLRACGYDGSQPVVDPMCGSGTFLIEAAEIAAGLMPGRSRPFAFENLVSFEPDQWASLKNGPGRSFPELRFFGSDRDAGAIRLATQNAERAGVLECCRFTQAPISDLQRPDGPAGLVMVNPPYGARIGNKKLLYGLYGALGATLKDRFQGWTVGLVTSEPALARATGLQFEPPGPPVAHGGLRVQLFRSGPIS